MAMVGEDFKSTIDTRKAGRGELKASCIGPSLPAWSRLIDHLDGKFTLLVRPRQAGKHILNIFYNGLHVRGSPFTLTVLIPGDASKVSLKGPGLMGGVLNSHEAYFVVDTSRAGGGELSIKITGPKGGFETEMSRERESDKLIKCRYITKEPGRYVIHVTWSGKHVPGSPFSVIWVKEKKKKCREFSGRLQAFYDYNKLHHHTKTET
ncbi:hypothetical protein HELRODRAFT_194486 [Helobdella robusta]|uniref:Uncharacterized protein n=1 Tax=Helobdella robusta TaxID=6412 RepID=T1FW41_HELRO|nr:hypothetical protein HELRODRAFT_194486 [Helobdella robusta]ESN91939.1 hypothetical protein HELRODRAFT_194486 [Helobdella robusta]